jgi:hypothetical protein
LIVGAEEEKEQFNVDRNHLEVLKLELECMSNI